MVEVIGLDEFAEWYSALNEAEQDAVQFVVDLLEERGVLLGFPYSSAINDAGFALRELRCTGKPIRVFYAFDPHRQAVLLLGGDKSGDARFYERMIPRVTKLWEEYLKSVGR